MNSINSSSLLHFTRAFDNLRNIIQNGLRYSFAFESVKPEIIINNLYPEILSVSVEDKQKYENRGVSIPMVCFCDIPLGRCSDHASKYGKYAIGLDKDFISDIKSSIMNPVLYINSENVDLIIRTFSKRKTAIMQETVELCKKKEFQEIFEKEGEKALLSNLSFKEQVDTLSEQKFSINFLIGLSKPYGVIENQKFNCFYDEREWRSFLVDNLDPWSYWKWGVTKQEHDEYKKDWNKEIAQNEGGYMTILEGYLYYAITHIITERDEEIEDVINIVMNSPCIFGNKNVSKRERMLLISKITSMERISLDY